MARTCLLSWIFWDPPRELFTIPFIDRPIAWYGLLFATGFSAGYFLVIRLLKGQFGALATQIADKLLWYVVCGTVIGARLGHVLFYEWDHYKHHLGDIIKVWEGGLASHGGTIGVIIALWLFARKSKDRYPGLSFIALLDLVSIPAALVATFIRIGNFINQEIVGTPSTLPWAVVFGHPADGGLVVPRHPVQLYEALLYLGVFLLLLWLWKRKEPSDRPGLLVGTLLIAVYGGRFLLEWTKAPINAIVNQSLLSMGQWLSLPLVIAGMLLLIFAEKKKNRVKSP